MNMNAMEVIEEASVIEEYPKFDVMGYLIVAFIIGGCAFIVMIRNCCMEYHAKFLSKRVKRPITSYGSTVEML